MKRASQPPLGPRPKFVMEWERIKELQDAIQRTLNANWPLSADLVAEYNELTARLEVEKMDEHLEYIDRLNKLKL